MEFSTEEAGYMTQPEESVPRDEALKALINTETRGCIIDAYACVGSDAIAFMHTFRNAHIDAVQIGDTADTQERFKRLCKNLQTYSRSIEGNPAHCTPHKCAIRDYIEQRMQPGTDIEMLYLDPPWSAPDGPQYSPEGLVELLNADALDPLHRLRRYPTVICFKVPADMDEEILKTALSGSNLIRETYTMCQCIPVTRELRTGERTAYHFHIYIKTPSA